jgi:hypothetical protein
MNIISFSLFGIRNEELPLWERRAYIRGFVFNVKMAALIFTKWICHVELDAQTYSDYQYLFTSLKEVYGITFNINPPTTLCKAMLWRLRPIFNEDSKYVMCRDCDSLVTYRERQAIEAFMSSGLFAHGLTDNVSHTVPLMGGLCSFSALQLRSKYKSWDNLLSLSPIGISTRGTDQQFLSSVVYPDFKKEMFGHYLKGMIGGGEGVIKKEIEPVQLDISPNLWLSNLCIHFAGAAGVNELETIRFFNQFDKENKFLETEKKYPELFYWHIL